MSCNGKMAVMSPQGQSRMTLSLFSGHNGHFAITALKTKGIFAMARFAHSITA
jgi:hypothetical protein